MTFTPRLFLFACLAGTAFALPAHAEDIPEGVQAMLDHLEAQTKVAPTYATIEADGDGGATITGLTLSAPQADGGPTIKSVTEKVVISDVSEESDGLYEIGSAVFTNTKVELSDPQMSVTVDVPEGSAESWFVTSADDDAPVAEKVRASMNIARKMSSGKATVTVMGQTLSLDGFEQTWDGDPETGAGTFSMKATNLAIPESAIAMLDTTGMLKQLGYGGLNFDFASTGKLDITEESLGLDFDTSIAGKDIGTIKIGATASGMPMAAYGELLKAGETGKEPDFSTMMPQLQAVNLGRVTFRFEDASITKRVLPMIAAMQGMDEAALVGNAGAIVQMGLMQLGNQAFSDQVVGAVNAFLKDPKSITIAAKPSAPVTVTDIMALNPAAPGEAITKLGVTVSAND